MRRVPGRRFLERHATALGLAAYAAASVLGVLAVASGIEAFVASIFDAPAKDIAQQPPTIARTGSLVLTQDNWAEMLRDPAYWASRKVGGNGNKYSGAATWKPQAPTPPKLERATFGVASQPSRKPAKIERDEEDDDGPTYRTVCVRLCDGAFFPLSFATTRDHFEDDAAKCEKSCGTASRMFFYKNPGAEPEEMEDQDGRPYKKLATAFLYKTQYIEQCKCKPHPWEESATDRHKVYALEAAKAKGSKVADAPLTELKAKLRQAELDTQAEKKRLAQAKIDEQKRAAADAKALKAAARTSGQAKPDTKPVVANVPPAPTSETTALYQPPLSKRPNMSGPSSSAGANSGVVIMRLGASQTKTVRISPPPPKSWQPLSDMR